MDITCPTFFSVFCLLLLLAEGNSLAKLEDASPCGEWTAFQDEKCFKIVTKVGHQTQQDAEIVCKTFAEELPHDANPKLITVKSKEEQDFLHKFLFVDNALKESAWLGLKEVGTSGDFEWNDGSQTVFTNWANQTVTDDQHHCVVMESGGGIAPAGSWVKVICDKSNMVVCERIQIMSLAVLQNSFVNFRQEQKKEMADARREITEARKENAELRNAIDDAVKEIDELKQRNSTGGNNTSVPLGFIYVQLPGKESPSKLWPEAEWKNVGSEYAGLFFRVEGGGAADFGQEQADNTRRLAQVYSAYNHEWVFPEIPSNGSLSGFAFTGRDGGGGNDVGLRLRLTTGEVRPRNKSVRIWQRIK